MSDDRRKNLRTQGKYTDGRAPKSRDKKQRSSLETKNSLPDTRVPRRHSDGNRDGNNSLTDESASFLKYEENSNYKFQQLEDVANPEEIKSQGTYILSITNNGESKILYEPNFISEDEGDKYFNVLWDKIEFDNKNIIIHGVEYPQPRLVAWFGPFPYKYSGVTLDAAEMPEVVKEIKGKVEEHLKSKGIEASFNSVLINLYRDGRDSVSWHSDDEIMLGITPTIASVSLGEIRKFEMKPKSRSFEDKSPSDSCKFLVHLTHGSLIVMTGCMQEDWLHRVPKEYHDKGPRINLTFRTVFSLEEAPGKGINLQPSKKSYGHNNSSASSKTWYKLDEEHFPSLQKDVVPVKSNVTCDKNDTSEGKKWKWVTESDGEHNVQDVATDIDIRPPRREKKEDFKSKNWSRNKFNDEKSLGRHKSFADKWDYEKATVNDKTATKKLWCEGYDSSVNSFQESHTDDESWEVKSFKSVNNSSANETEKNKSYEKIDPRKVHSGEKTVSVTNSQQQYLSQDESSVKSYNNNKSNSFVTTTQDNDVNGEEFQNTCHDNKNNLWADSLEESDLDAMKATKTPLNVDAKAFPNSYKNVSQENDFEYKMPQNASYHVENSQWVSVSEENNLEIKQPSKMVLNVEAKEFIPSNIKSAEFRQYSDFNLEDLVRCDLTALQGENLHDHTHYLKIRVHERFQEICRLDRKDRKELEFLLELTDGSQTDKNQRLISEQICRIVENNLRIKLPVSNDMPHFERSPRQRGYDNQNYYPNKGKRYPNQSRNEKSYRRY